MALGFRRGRKAGRRANYANRPAGVMKVFANWSPTGWVNWLGTGLFGFLFFALVADAIASLVTSRGNDWIAAGLMAAAVGYMAYLFATSPYADEEAAAMADAEARKQGSKS